MLAPYSEIARSKVASAQGACSALAWMSGNPARSGPAGYGRWPAARQNCPGRPAARRGGRARPRRSRCRSPARCCQVPPRSGGRTPHLFLGDAPDTPAGLGCCPVAQARPGIVSGPPVPGQAVAEHMIRRLGHSSQRLRQPATFVNQVPTARGARPRIRAGCPDATSAASSNSAHSACRSHPALYRLAFWGWPIGQHILTNCPGSVQQFSSKRSGSLGILAQACPAGQSRHAAPVGRVPVTSQGAHSAISRGRGIRGSEPVARSAVRPSSAA